MTSPPALRRSGGPHPVALVTGANRHRRRDREALAASGARVLVTGLPLAEERDPAVPDAHYASRSRHPESVATAIRAAGGAAHAVVLDLAAGEVSVPAGCPSPSTHDGIASAGTRGVGSSP